MNSRELRSLEEVDAIITRLYRRFRDWSERGFGPEDVTWCEVKADILEIISSSSREAAAPTSSPKGLERWREIVLCEFEGVDFPLSLDSAIKHTLSAIRRSVEEALGAAHAPKGAPLGGEDT